VAAADKIFYSSLTKHRSNIIVSRLPITIPHALPYLDMSHAVIIQVGAGGEPFAAHLTLVRFLPAVDAPMCV